MAHPSKIPYSKDISNKIKEGIDSGLSVVQIFGSIQPLQNAPGSIQTFYRIYKQDIDLFRSEITGKVGKKVIDQALEGDFKSQELYLRSRGGWSPQSTVTEVEEDSTEDASAISSLMAALGKLEELEETEE